MSRLLLNVAILSLTGLISKQAVLGQTQINPQTAPPAAEQHHYLPGYVTTTTAARPAPEDNIKPSGKIHKGYASVGFLSSTTAILEGYSILEYRGLVEGAAVRVPTWNEDASASIQEQVGGKIDSYTHMCEEARIEAFTTMVERAKELGANAIVGIHFDSQVMPLDKQKFATGVVCVGTAVTVQHK